MYNGYRVKLNGIVLSDDFISRGSYSSQKEERILDEFHDAYGVRHETPSPHEPAIISFTIRERSMREQKELSGIFSTYKNIFVEYWDDVNAEYKTGYFKMERPVFKHRNIQGGAIAYNKTTITLREY